MQTETKLFRLGMEHDGEGNTCTSERKSIMAAVVESSYNKYTWSPCSANILKRVIKFVVRCYNYYKYSINILLFLSAYYF